MRLVVHNYVPARDLDARREFVDAWEQARSVDPLKYLRGVTSVKFVNDIDNHWNASYTPNSDEITIANKFHAKKFLDKVQTLLHEGGHRGQFLKDTPTYERFLKQKLDRTALFLDMANEVHREDYAKNGISKAEMASEIFAESYSRFAMGMGMPDPLLEFWTRRTHQ